MITLASKFQNVAFEVYIVTYYISESFRLQSQKRSVQKNFTGKEFVLSCPDGVIIYCHSCIDFQSFHFCKPTVCLLILGTSEWVIGLDGRVLNPFLGLAVGFELGVLSLLTVTSIRLVAVVLDRRGTLFLR